MSEAAAEHEPVVVRDKRRIDPETGQARQVDPGAADAPPPAAAPDADPVAELTADLQRLSAEYANYRKRVARDQAAVVELANAALADRLLPLLDDVDRAREHGDLEGAFKVVGEALEAVVGRLGVERFGVAGDAFDPQVHEAVMSAPEQPGATEATCVQVFSPGYRLPSGRVLRPAKVVVAEPAAAHDPAGAEVVEGVVEPAVPGDPGA